MPNHRTRGRAVLVETSAPRIPPLGVVAYTPNPTGRVQPGVGHERKPGDPFRTWTMRRQSRQK
jgi:hypothetical protein